MQNSSPKKYKYKLILQLFCFSPSAIVLPALFNFLALAISEKFFTFQRQKKIPEEAFICWMSAKQLAKRGRCKLQAPIKGGNFDAKLAHFCQWLFDCTYHFSLTWKNIVRDSDRMFPCFQVWKTSFAPLIGWNAFAHENYDIAFGQWGSSACFKIHILATMEHRWRLDKYLIKCNTWPSP